MNCLGWDCRRLGNPQSVNRLHNFMQHWDPKIVFLSETKLKKSGMERIKRKVENFDGLIVPSGGKSGGACYVMEERIKLTY